MTLVKNSTEQKHIQNTQTPDWRARIEVFGGFLSLFTAFTNVVQVTSSQGSQPRQLQPPGLRLDDQNMAFMELDE